MSQYAAIADLYLYGFREEARGDLANAVLNAHLSAASTGPIDGHLGQRYGQPLASWTTEVTQWTAQIAAFTTAPVRGIAVDTPDYQVLKGVFDNVMRTLGRVQRGDYSPVGLVPVTAPPGTQAYEPNVQSFSIVNLATGERGCNRGWT